MMQLSRRSVVAALAAAGVLALCAGWLTYYLWSAAEDRYFELRQVERYRTSPDALLKDLAHGQIKSGDPVDDLITTHSLEKDQFRHDEYVTIWHRTSEPEGTVRILARNGRLVYASHEWTDSRVNRLVLGEYMFIKDLSPDEMKAYESSFLGFVAQLRETRKAARLAVAGFGATFEPQKQQATTTDPEN